jgi:hypothetical protein
MLTLRSISVTSIRTLGITAADESETNPEIDPADVWAAAWRGTSNTPAATHNQRAKTLISFS